MVAIDEALERVEGWLVQLDPSRVGGAEAARLVAVCSKLERLGSTARMLLAPRVQETRAWQGEGDASAADWLARQAGTPVADAAAVLATGKQLRDQPAVDRAARDGRLSAPQVRAVAQAVAADPTSAQRLLDTAGRAPFGELSREARAVRSAATDSPTRERRIRAQRSVRTYTDDDGAFNLHLRGPGVHGARIVEQLRPLQEQAFQSRRTSGTHDTFDNRSYDAFLQLLGLSEGGVPHGTAPAAGTVVSEAQAASPQSPPVPRIPRGDNTKVIVLISHTALARGHAEPGETCEIAGLGPVSVAVVDELMSDAFLAAVITKGRDVVNVAHLGRRVNAFQRTAIEARRLGCSNEACNRTVAIQIDHRVPWRNEQVTKLDNQDPLCPECHRRKTHHGYNLAPGTGRRAFVAPGHPEAAAREEPP